MSTTSDPTPSDQAPSAPSTPQTPEEIRREMKSRFDAVNVAAEDGHQQRRDASNYTASEENKRWLRPQDPTGSGNDPSAGSEPD